MKACNVYKIYFDTCILSRFTDLRISVRDAQSLPLLREIQGVQIVVSSKVKQELKEVPNPIRNPMLQFLYMCFQEIPDRILETPSLGCYGSARYGSTMYGGGGGWVHPALQGLREIFDSADAEHIFLAAEDGCDYFVTLDERSILSRVRANQRGVESLCGKMRFGSPAEVLALIEGSCP